MTKKKITSETGNRASTPEEIKSALIFKGVMFTITMFAKSDKRNLVIKHEEQHIVGIVPDAFDEATQLAKLADLYPIEFGAANDWRLMEHEEIVRIILDENHVKAFSASDINNPRISGNDPVSMIIAGFIPPELKTMLKELYDSEIATFMTGCRDPECRCGGEDAEIQLLGSDLLELIKRREAADWTEESHNEWTDYIRDRAKERATKH